MPCDSPSGSTAVVIVVGVGETLGFSDCQAIGRDEIDTDATGNRVCLPDRAKNGLHAAR